jgi:hypothetical protein
MYVCICISKNKQFLHCRICDCDQISIRSCIYGCNRVFPDMGLSQPVTVFFTERIPSISKLTYAERLAHLNLDTLELGRLRFDLIFYYKVFNHLTSFDPQTVFGIYQPPACLRSNTSFIQKPAHMCNKTLATLVYRGIDAWNYLSADLRHSQSLLSFKRGFRNVELTRFLKSSVYI